MRYFITLIILLIITLYGQDNQEKELWQRKLPNQNQNGLHA